MPDAVQGWGWLTRSLGDPNDEALLDAAELIQAQADEIVRLAVKTGVFLANEAYNLGEIGVLHGA